MQIPRVKISRGDLAEKSVTYSGECVCPCCWIRGPSQEISLGLLARSVYEISAESLKSSLGIRLNAVNLITHGKTAQHSADQFLGKNLALD